MKFLNFYVQEITPVYQKDVILQCSWSDVSFYKLATYKLKEAGVRTIVIREILDIHVGFSSSCSGERRWEGFGAWPTFIVADVSCL